MLLALIGLGLVLKARFRNLSLVFIFIFLFLPDFVFISLLLVSTEFTQYYGYIPLFFSNFDIALSLLIGNLAISESMGYSHNLLIMGIVSLAILGVILALRQKPEVYILATLPLIHLAATLFSIYQCVYLAYPFFPEISSFYLIDFYVTQVLSRQLLLPYIPIDLFYWLADLLLFVVAIFLSLYWHAEADRKKKRKELEKGESGAIEKVLKGAKKF